MHTQSKWKMEMGTIVADDPDANDNYPIAVCEGPDWKANATLIVSAPDLLDSLSDTIGFLEALVDKGRIDAGHVLRKVKATIAKAKGE